MLASLRSEGVRVHPGMPFGFPSESAFGFAGILSHLLNCPIGPIRARIGDGHGCVGEACTRDLRHSPGSGIEAVGNGSSRWILNGAERALRGVSIGESARRDRASDLLAGERPPEIVEGQVVGARCSGVNLGFAINETRSEAGSAYSWLRWQGIITIRHRWRGRCGRRQAFRSAFRLLRGSVLSGSHAARY